MKVYLGIILMVILCSGCTMIEETDLKKDDTLYTVLERIETVDNGQGNLLTVGDVVSRSGKIEAINWTYFGDFNLLRTSKKPNETQLEYEGSQLSLVSHIDENKEVIQSTRFYYGSYGLDSIITVNNFLTGNDLPQMIFDWFNYDENGKFRYILRTYDWGELSHTDALVSQDFYFGKEANRPNYFFIDSVAFGVPAIINKPIEGWHTEDLGYVNIRNRSEVFVQDGTTDLDEFVSSFGNYFGLYVGQIPEDFI